jgi:hypothetical protein
MKYAITLKSGVITVVENDDVRNPVGLWIWSMGKATPQVLSFDNNVSILSTEIAMIEEVNNA